MVLATSTKLQLGVEVVISLQSVGPMLCPNSVEDQTPHSDSAKIHSEIGLLPSFVKLASDVHPRFSKISSELS